MNQKRNVDSSQKVSSNFNVPNVLTSLRIIAIPFFVWLLLKSDGVRPGWLWGAFACFVVLMITDKLDGDIARSRGLITDFGKIADPIADKALMISALVSLNIVHLLPVWITVVIVVRELGITFWRMYELRRGKVVPASRGGKIKTTLQTLAVSLYLIPFPEWFHYPRLIIMLLAVAVTVITGIQYLIDAKKTNQTKA